MRMPLIGRAAVCQLGGSVTVLVAVGGLLGCGGDPATSALAPPPPPLTSFTPLAPPFPVDSTYEADVEGGVASALHLGRNTITAELRSSPGSTLMNLAKPRGIAEDSLDAIILRSLGKAADSEVRAGRWSARDADEETGYWQSQSVPDLISEVTGWFVRG